MRFRPSSKQLLGWVQLIGAIGLCGLLLVSLQTRQSGNVGLASQIQTGTCLGWVNAVGKQTEGVVEWPSWSDVGMVVSTIGIRGNAWGDESSVPVTLASFLNAATAKRWNLAPTQPHVKPGTVSAEFSLQAAKGFSLRVPWHEFGGFSVSNEAMMMVSFGFEAAGGRASGLYIDIAGQPNTEFTLQEDEKPRKGFFGETGPTFASWPPTYPEALLQRTWGGALRPNHRESNNDCASRMVSGESFGLDAMTGPPPLSRSRERTSIRFTTAVKNVKLSGATGTLATDGGKVRPIGPEDLVEVAGDLTQLSVDTDRGSIGLFGPVSRLTVNREDVHDRQIESWPWYLQAFFGATLSWALTGVWQHRKHLLR